MESHSGNWPDRSAKLSGYWFCLCGMIALALDAVNGAVNDPFAVVQGMCSPVAMRWLFPVGFIVSVAACVGGPTSLRWRIVATLTLTLFSLGTAFLWIGFQLT